MNEILKKILVTLIAVAVLAACGFGIYMLVKPDLKISDGDFTATYKGNNRRTLTVGIEGKLADGYVWHVVNENGDAVSYDIKKSKSNKIKLKLKGLDTKSGTLYIYANQNDKIEDFSLVEPESPYSYTKSGKEKVDQKKLKAYAKYQEAYQKVMNDLAGSDNAVTMKLGYALKDKLKFMVTDFSLGMGSIPMPIAKDMKNPIYQKKVENDIELSVPYFSEDFTLFVEDDAVITVKDKEITENKTYFLVSPRSLGKTNAVLTNAELGIKTVIEFQVTAEEQQKIQAEDENGEKLEIDDVLTSPIKVLNITNVSENVEAVYTDDEIADINRVYEVVKKLYLPAGVIIDGVDNLSQDGDDDLDLQPTVSEMAVTYMGHQYKYSVSNKLSIADFKKNYESFDSKKITDKSQKLDDLYIDGFEYKDKKMVADIAMFTVGGVNCCLASDDSSWDEMLDFIKSLKLVDIKEIKGKNK